MKNIYSLHKITDEAKLGFNSVDYSRFKFGDGLIAREFGINLAKGFIRDVLVGEFDVNQFVVISSPYAFVPTATYAMKTAFVYELNQWLADHNFPVVQEAKVHRTITYKEDYGNLDAAQRLALIAKDSFHIDSAFLTGKTLLFLDDIRITGSHERMIERMVAANNLKNDIYMLYFAQLVNENIHPSIENTLNYHYVKSIFDLDDIIKGQDFQINTRIVKYLLSSEAASFSVFIKNQGEPFIRNLYNMALGNSYHRIENYSANIDYIKQLLFVNKANLIVNGN